MKINTKYLQYASEALIPLLGFFLWEWSLYFILLFYFLDMLVAEILMHFKSRKINEVSKNEKEWFRLSTLSAFLLMTTIIIVHFTVIHLVNGINFAREISAFWNYEDMGVKQGYVLIPLVLFVGYQQYKMEFLLPAKYRKISITTIWKKHMQALIVVLAFSIVCLALSFVVIFPTIVYVLGIVVLTIGYKLRFDD